MSRVAFDTNILVYLAEASADEADRRKSQQARDVLRRIKGRAELFVPVQALGELFVVMSRSRVPPERVRSYVSEMAGAFAVADTTGTTLASAMDLAIDHRLQFWDSMILAAAADAGCSLLLSEDMHDGFTTRGVTIVNPLAAKLHSKLAKLLA